MRQGPAKKAKGLPKKKKPVAPKKKLAKKAAKKGVEKSKNEILEHIQKAEKIDSKNVGEDMDKCVKAIEGAIEEWHIQGVEDFALQRFSARILRKLKDLNVLVAVDHAVFKKELDFIHPLEMNITKEDNVTLSRTVVLQRTENLLKSVMVPEEGNVMESTMQGMAWKIIEQSDSKILESKKIFY